MSEKFKPAYSHQCFGGNDYIIATNILLQAAVKETFPALSQIYVKVLNQQLLK